MIKSTIINLLGFVLEKLSIILELYLAKKMNKKLGNCGINAGIHYPFNVKGETNIFLDDGVSIGAGSTIFTTRAKFIVGKNSFSGPNLTVITGDHPFLPGSYMLNLKKDELKKSMDISIYDKDVIIEQDVWLGVNVTILKGVRIGRGAIVAAGSLVIKDIPPYSITGGVPAKVIKFKWNKEEILHHEKKIIENEEERLSEESINIMFNSYLKNP